MATLKLTITPEKAAKDGSHKIRVAVGHKSVTRYIVTNIKIDSVSQFKNGQVVKRPDAAVLNTKLRNLLNSYQEKLDKIENISIYDCKQLRQLLLNSTTAKEEATFQAVCRKYMSELEEEGRNSYATLLERNCRYFTEFTKGDILLSDITPVLIEGYSRFLKVKKGVGDTTLGMMMSRTRTIINRGVKQQLVKYDVHPFLNYSISAPNIREVDLPIEVFNKILLQINFKNVEVLEYVRTKSRNTTHGTRTISFSIPSQAKDIIDLWMNKNTGRLDFGYKFSYPNFSRYLTRSLASLAKELGITEKVVYYSARKSFAQYASEIGIPDGIIDYCLGHSDKSKGVIRYYTKVRQKQADMAIARVIDYVNNPEKYKEYIELRSDIMLMRG